MGFSDGTFDVVADILLDPKGHANSLQNFNDFVVALSADSGLPVREAQSRLVAKMLQHPRHPTMYGNVIYLTDYRNLQLVN